MYFQKVISKKWLFVDVLKITDENGRVVWGMDPRNRIRYQIHMDPQHSLAGQVEDQNGGLCKLGWAAYIGFPNTARVQSKTLVNFQLFVWQVIISEKQMRKIWGKLNFLYENEMERYKSNNEQHTTGSTSNFYVKYKGKKYGFFSWTNHILAQASRRSNHIPPKLSRLLITSWSRVDVILWLCLSAPLLVSAVGKENVKG